MVIAQAEALLRWAYAVACGYSWEYQHCENARAHEAKLTVNRAADRGAFGQFLLIGNHFVMSAHRMACSTPRVMQTGHAACTVVLCGVLSIKLHVAGYAVHQRLSVCVLGAGCSFAVVPPCACFAELKETPAMQDLVVDTYILVQTLHRLLDPPSPTPSFMPANPGPSKDAVRLVEEGAARTLCRCLEAGGSCAPEVMILDVLKALQMLLLLGEDDKASKGEAGTLAVAGQ